MSNTKQNEWVKELGKIIHQIVHMLGLHKGRVYSKIEGESIYIGFQCGSCGKVEDLHCVDKIIDRELGIIDRELNEKSN